jgi:hypothetical protein
LTVNRLESASGFADHRVNIVLTKVISCNLA